MPKKAAPKSKGRAKMHRYTGKDGVVYALNDREKKFCDAFLQFQGSVVDAVYEAGYSPKNAKVAAAISYENLKKPHIFSYIDLKLEEAGLTDDHVDKQTLFMLNQYGDLKAKIAAVKEYNKIKGRYAPSKIELVDPLEEISDEDIAAEQARRAQR